MPLSADATIGQHIGDRKEQQDRVAFIPSSHARGTAIVVVADGAGGYKGGAAAAEQVLATAKNLFERFSPKHQQSQHLLRDIVTEAHTIIRLNRQLTEQEPHSTIMAMVLQPGRADWGWVGDSRLYHFRNGVLKQRTKDHSFVQQQIDEGRWRADQWHKHPNRNLLLQALGHSEVPTPSFGSSAPLLPGDTFLLCSDGLWEYFSDNEISKALTKLSPRKAAEMLVNAARVRAHGKGDNISVAVLKLDDAPAPPRGRHAAPAGAALPFKEKSPRRENTFPEIEEPKGFSSDNWASGAKKKP